MNGCVNIKSIDSFDNNLRRDENRVEVGEIIIIQSVGEVEKVFRYAKRVVGEKLDYSLAHVEVSYRFNVETNDVKQ